ncbi:CBS domain-containing protein [Candidatus Pacearchaeota archaeon]|nr:CBS domain-containing protein [Candidatus Pacearchaeota archaeon]
MEKRIRVGDIMTRNYVHVKPNTALIDCAKEMIKKRVGSLIIKEGDELKGIITEKDIVWALTKKKADFGSILAKDVAARKLITIKPDTGIEEALQKMNRSKIRRMPVVSNKKIIGYITLKDIVKFMPSIFQENREFERIREEEDKIQRSSAASKGKFTEDLCEECGNFDILEKIDGRMICESCKDIM